MRARAAPALRARPKRPSSRLGCEDAGGPASLPSAGGGAPAPLASGARRREPNAQVSKNARDARRIRSPPYPRWLLSQETITSPSAASLGKKKKHGTDVATDD